MVSLPDVKAGRVSLADLVEVNHYLDIKADIEQYAMDRAKEDVRHGKRSR